MGPRFGIGLLDLRLHDVGLIFDRERPEDGTLQVRCVQPVNPGPLA